LTDIYYLEVLCGFQAPPGVASRKIPVAHSERETPLPIPNRAVKPFSADGTWGATPWESRSPPVLIVKAGPRRVAARFRSAWLRATPSPNGSRSAATPRHPSRTDRSPSERLGLAPMRGPDLGVGFVDRLVVPRGLARPRGAQGCPTASRRLEEARFLQEAALAAAMGGARPRGLAGRSRGAGGRRRVHATLASSPNGLQPVLA
jgi:hypothetical protein